MSFQIFIIIELYFSLKYRKGNSYNFAFVKLTFDVTLKFVVT